MVSCHRSRKTKKIKYNGKRIFSAGAPGASLNISVHFQTTFKIFVHILCQRNYSEKNNLIDFSTVNFGLDSKSNKLCFLTFGIFN